MLNVDFAKFVTTLAPMFGISLGQAGAQFDALARAFNNVELRPLIPDLGEINLAGTITGRISGARANCIIIDDPFRDVDFKSLRESIEDFSEAVQEPDETGLDKPMANRPDGWYREAFKTRGRR